MNKGILKSKRMIGMIITLAVGAVVMLGFAVYMFIYAIRNDIGALFGVAANDSNGGIWLTRNFVFCIAAADLLIALEKVVPLIASVLMYKRYPDVKGLNVLKGVAVVGMVFYCISFAVLFVYAFVAAFQSPDGYRMAAFKSSMLPATVVFFFALKFLSLSLTVSSVKKNVINGVMFLLVTTAMLAVGDIMIVFDIFSSLQADMFIINIGVVLGILAAENLFLFLMTRKYLLMKASEQNQKTDDEKKEKA